MKNTKIMAALAIFLAAVLLIGSVSAAAPAEGDQNSTLTFNQTTGSVGVPVEVNLTLSGNAGNADKYALNYTTDGGATFTAVGEFTLVKDTTYTTGNISVELPVAGTYVFYVSNMTTPNLGVKYNGTKTFTVTNPLADRTVAQGEDAFVYEHIAIDGANSAKLTKYSEGTNPTAVNQISGTGGVFYLTEAAVNGQYGAYYYSGTPAETGNKNFIYIWYPELSLQGELTTGADNAVSGDSIDGKTINKNTNVTFLINTPKVGPAFDAGKATVKVVFTTPAGGKTTDFGTTKFGTLDVGTFTQTKADSTQPGNNAAAGTWTAQAEYVLPGYFSDYAKKSNTISFTVQSTTLTLTASKDSVIRSNPFTVTIQGDSQMMYFVYLEGANAEDINPTLQPAQSGMKVSKDNVKIPVAALYNSETPLVENKPNLENTWGYFETDASGQRVVQYNTNADTEDKTYTVKVYALDMKYSDIDVVLGQQYLSLPAGADYDSVKVKVEKGSVTITASGDGSYFIGQEIKLTGTNTDSDNIFLFITGQNLKENGIILKDLPNKNDAYLAKNPISVKTDDTWEYKWDTSKIALDTGAYTIYATSVLTNGKSSDPIFTTSPNGVPATQEAKSKYGITGDGAYIAVKLSDSEYATVSVNLKQPFVSATPSATIIAQGDKLYVRGTAEGDPDNLKLYIFGPNFFEDYTITVEDDSTYEKKIDIGSSWASNQYFVVVQHPMYNGVFDAELGEKDNGATKYFYINNVTTGGSMGSQGSFVVWGNNKLQGSQAADALTKMIDDANIDDKYTKLTFTVAAPWIAIKNPGDQASGSKFTITGTTNLAVDDQVLIEVMSSSFTAVDKTSTSTTSGVSQTTKVVKGDTDNTWSIDVDTTNWKLDEYTIKVQGIEVDVTTTTNFNLVEKLPDTPKPTSTGATTVPTTATATATATPATPGFGAFIALAGLGAVALLVLRRN